MWTYIIRRLLLMIPTMFGVTVVSFCIMQLAPGDPMLSQLGGGGTMGAGGQNRDAFLLQKRQLNLDKPLLLNFNYLTDYADEVRAAAFYRGLDSTDTAQDLTNLLGDDLDPIETQRLAFLRSLKIPYFEQQFRPNELSDRQLADSNLTREQWNEQKSERLVALAGSVQGYVQVWTEDIGKHGVPYAIELLADSQSDLKLKIGAIRSLNKMILDPFVYSYDRTPDDAMSPQVMGTWSFWWNRNKDRFPPLTPEQVEKLEARFESMLALKKRSDVFSAIRNFDRNDAPFFVDKLLGDSSLEEKSLASTVLVLHNGRSLKTDVPLNADATLVDNVANNWIEFYRTLEDQYSLPMFTRIVNIVRDTQYAHMVVRLVTFDFGQSALRTREPVSQKIWNAFKVSAPLMILGQLVIYFIAVPLGILCAVKRGTWVDRLISMKLFLLYSVPPFVAGMLFLLYLCYGGYLKWFPMEHLHSPDADQMSWPMYLLDYLWHAFLPVVCLSLFSLAGLAMYSRTSLLDALGQDYIRTARAKGLPRSKVIFKHALRNSLIPVITLFANFLPAMLGGSVLIEYLFNIPGMGNLSFASIELKDFPTLMALIYIDAIVVLLSILATDLMYVLIDPRISFASQESKA